MSPTPTTATHCPESGCHRPPHPAQPTAHVKTGPTVDDRHDRAERRIR